MNEKVKKSNFFLVSFFLVSTAVLTMLVSHTFKVMEDIIDNTKNVKDIYNRTEDIRFFDEVMTSSALLAAGTGNAGYEARYRLYSSKLDSAIQRLSQIYSVHQDQRMYQELMETNRANLRLKAMEQTVFDLIHQGRTEEAYEILTGPEYARPKLMYLQGLRSFMALEESNMNKQQEKFYRMAKTSRWYFGLIMLFLVVIWLYITRFLNRSRSVLLNQKGELEIQVQARRDSEAELLKSRELLQESIKASGVGLWDRNLQTNEVYHSPEWKKQIGYDDSELQGGYEVFLDHLHPDDVERVQTSTREFFEGRQENFESEYRFRHKNGSYRWILGRATIHHDNEGNPLRLMGSHLDITERKINELELEKLKTNLELILNSVGEGIYGLDMNGKVIFVNEVFETLTGWKKEEITDVSLHSLIHYVKPDGSPYPEEDCPAIRSMKDGKIYRNEEYFIKKDGSGFYIEHVSTPIVREGKVEGVVVIFKDITARKQAEALVKRNETKFRTLFESANDAIFIMNGEVFIDCNKKTEEIFGCSRNDIIGHSPLNFSPERQADGHLSAEKARGKINAALGGQPQFFEWTHCRLDRTTFDAEVNLNRIELDNRFYLQAIVRDVSERKEAEAKIKESEAKYRVLAEFSPEMIYLIDTRGCVSYVNKVASDQFHASAQEIVGKHLTDIFPPGLAEQNLAGIHAVIETKKTAQNEVEMVFPSGKKWVEARLSPVFDEKNNVIGVLGLSNDITERKQAQEAIAALSRRYQLILQTASDGIHVLDEKGNLVEVNDAFCEMLGYPKKELMKLNVTDWDAQWPVEELLEILKEPLQQPMVFDTLHRRKDGTLIDVEISTVSILLDGHLYHYGACRDITYRKRAEEELKRSNEELSKLNAEKDKFFSIIAHDLRSPFMGLLGISEIIASEIDGMPRNNLVELGQSLNVTAKNLYKLLNNLLDWAQLHNGTLNFLPEDRLLKEEVNQVINSIHQTAEQKKIKISNQVEKDQKVFADEKMIRVILLNLLSNAVKFTEHGGEVTIRSRAVGNDRIEISVSDTGIGISDRNMAKLFRTDEKVSSLGTDGEPSTGLGLLLCKEFVEKHSGLIHVESELGKGSVFYFTLPSHN